MALFDTDSPSTLEDVLGRQAETQGMALEQQFAKKRRQNAAQQAHAGRLGSGVSNYQAGDLAAEELGAFGDLESSLAESLGAIPTEDYESGQQDARMQELAKLIGSLNKKGGLQEILSGAGQLGGIGAALGGPWGAGIGAGLGGLMSGMG